MTNNLMPANRVVFYLMSKFQSPGIIIQCLARTQRNFNVHTTSSLRSGRYIDVEKTLCVYRVEEINKVWRKPFLFNKN